MSRRAFMVGGAGAVALGAAGGVGAAAAELPGAAAVQPAATVGLIPTFGLLNTIVSFLGTTKATFYPFLESTGSVLRCRSYGGGTSGVRILVAAGAATSLDPFSAGGRYPYYHIGGVHSLYFHPGEGTVENLHMAGEDHEQYEFPGDVPFSLGAWILPRAEATGTIISKASLPGGDREYRLLWDGESQLIEFTLYDAANNAAISRRSITPIAYNKWVFVVATCDGNGSANGLAIKINAAPDNGAANSQGAYSGMVAGTARYIIGATGPTSAPIDVFTGRMALPFICGKLIPAADITQIFTTGGRLLGIF